MASVTYRNVVTGRIVERDAADEDLDRSRRWVRVGADGEAVEVADPDAGAELTLPSGNATTEEWRTFAVAAGMDADEAAGMGRNELREYFGG